MKAPLALWPVDAIAICLLIVTHPVSRCQGVETFRVYPWTTQFVNNIAAADVTRVSTFPDLDPSSLPRHAQFSMAAGDFLEVERITVHIWHSRNKHFTLYLLQVYTEPSSWDCVSTCFFIDCANNICAFIETIYKILKNGKFHFTVVAVGGRYSFVVSLSFRWSVDQPGPSALPLQRHSWRELDRALLRYGQGDHPRNGFYIRSRPEFRFHFEWLRHKLITLSLYLQKERTGVKTTYTQNVRSMLKYEYESVFFVCRKPWTKRERFGMVRWSVIFPPFLFSLTVS